MDNPTGATSEHGDTPADETPQRRDMTTVKLVLAPFLAVICLPVLLMGMIVLAVGGDEALERFLDVALRPFMALIWLVLRPFGYSKADVYDL